MREKIAKKLLKMIVQILFLLLNSTIYVCQNTNHLSS